MPTSTPAHYWAFISYSSKDRRVGEWLRKRIENYSIPKELCGQKLEDGTVLQSRLRPVFRDRDELASSDDLTEKIREALEKSRYLIVLCSPNSAKSQWVNKEILDFQAMGKGTNVLALILEGEPNSADPETECFPPALRLPVEPIAGDLRKEGDGKDRGFLKILAGIAQLDFDQIYRRHQRVRRQRLIAFTSASLALAAVLAVLSIVAVLQTKEAERQRVLAEANEGRALEQETIASNRAQQLSIDLSNRQLRDGLDALEAGKTEEGLAMLVLSLRSWNENRFARDRLLYELMHREWLLPEIVSPFPHPVLSGGTDATKEGVSFTASLRIVPLEDGSVRVEEGTETFSYEEESGSRISRSTVWSETGGWMTEVSREEKLDSSGLDPLESILPISPELSLVLDPIEGPMGMGALLAMQGDQQVPFKETYFDGKIVSLNLSGIPAFDPDSSRIAVAGLLPPSLEGAYENYYESGVIYLSFFDVATLLMSSSPESYQFQVPNDLDIVRVWFDGGDILLHLTQDSRDFDRVDRIELSGEYPRHALKNRIVTSPSWTYSEGKLFQLGEYGLPDGETLLQLEVYEKKPSPVYLGEGIELLTEKDVVFFKDQLDENSTEPGPEWRRWSSFGEDSDLLRSNDSNWRGGAVTSSRAGTAMTAALVTDRSIRVKEADGSVRAQVEVPYASGEGGRTITGLGFSPSCDYLMVEGLSVGGGVFDWELVATDLGARVFPKSDIGDLNLMNDKAIGFSRDGKYLVLQPEMSYPDFSTEGETDRRTEFLRTHYRRNFLSDVRSQNSRDCLFVPIVACAGATPDWFLSAIEEVFGLRASGNGAVVPIRPREGLLEFLTDLADQHPESEYGIWLRAFLGQVD